MSNSVRPQRWQPTRFLHPWDSPGKNTGVGCHFLLQCVKVKSLSRIQLFATPWTAAYQAPPSMAFSRQEYWSGLPLNDYLFGILGIWLQSWSLPLIVQISASYLTFPGLDLLYNEDNNTYFTRLLWKIKDRIHGNSFAQFPHILSM